ncbi:hypothetical protein KA005_38395 [bacterium]|nr:hypothetical protein [bacterium]
MHSIILTWDKIKATTSLAVLFVFGDDVVWIPKSQITDLDQENKTLEIPLWLAEEKEIENYEY